MIPTAFDYVRPSTVADAVSALVDGGEDARPLAGGQSLNTLLKLRLARPSLLVDLGGIKEFAGVATHNDVFEFGAMATHNQILRHAPAATGHRAFTDAAAVLGDRQIRNRGTVAGSLAHADPAAEWPAVALALDAELDLVGPQGRRTVRARDFFVTYFTTTIAPDEIVAEVRVPLPNGRSGSCFLELARRHGDFAISGVAALVTLGGDGAVAGARIALIGAGDRAVRAEAAEAVLAGREATDERVAEAAGAVDQAINPGADVHASAGYRRHAAAVLTRRALALALARAEGGESDGTAS